jgi:hypothetical protein
MANRQPAGPTTSSAWLVVAQTIAAAIVIHRLNQVLLSSIDDLTTVCDRERSAFMKVIAHDCVLLVYTYWWPWRSCSGEYSMSDDIFHTSSTF